MLMIPDEPVLHLSLSILYSDHFRSLLITSDHFRSFPILNRRPPPPIAADRRRTSGPDTWTGHLDRTTRRMPPRPKRQRHTGRTRRAQASCWTAAQSTREPTEPTVTHDVAAIYRPDHTPALTWPFASPGQPATPAPDPISLISSLISHKHVLFFL